jgi:hypothetical protein
MTDNNIELMGQDYLNTLDRVIEKMEDPEINRWWSGKRKLNGKTVEVIEPPQGPKESARYERGNSDEGIPMSTLQALKYAELCRRYGEKPARVKIVPRCEAKALAKWFGPPKRGNPGQQYHNITTDGESQT